MASITFNLTNSSYTDFDNRTIFWDGNHALGNIFSADGLDQSLTRPQLFYAGLTAGEVRISITEFNDRFTPEFEATGRIIFEASDGVMLEVMIADADMTEPYEWAPANSAEVITFANHVRSLTNRSATITLTDDPTAFAPSFTDNTGNAQSWTQNTAIGSITVPAADGEPTPTYAAIGSLPAGINFNTGTRVISGTPTAVGNGTIRIRATNSEGTADWTVAYATVAQPVAPNFANDTGDDQTWTQNVGIASITVPTATGNPTPTYAAVGSLPNGISFNANTRAISGTPTATGFGTITIRATNSEGSDDWTVDYTTSAPASAPSRPAAPTLTVGSDTEITAVGVAPNNGGDTITSYDWRHRITSPLGAWVNRSNVSNLTQVFTGLEAARTYRFQFRATNSVGDSPYSPSANATTEATPTTLTAPAFADDTGDAQNWTIGTVIASITVPTATGNPTPTYAAFGVLPAGITFNTGTRVISGTPTASGSGTITIRATNSEGTADWTVAYTATGVAPSFTDNTGDPQTWITGMGFFPITVPAASGVPTPIYFSVGALPNGVAFNINTRVISGAPNTAGSGTITIRASNSEGSDDWTLAYTITDLPPEPVTGTLTYTVVDADGAAVSINVDWTVNP